MAMIAATKRKPLHPRGFSFSDIRCPMLAVAFRAPGAFVVPHVLARGAYEFHPSSALSRCCMPVLLPLLEAQVRNHTYARTRHRA